MVDTSGAGMSTLHELLSLPPILSGVIVAQCLVFCVLFLIMIVRIFSIYM